MGNLLKSNLQKLLSKNAKLTSITNSKHAEDQLLNKSILLPGDQQRNPLTRKLVFVKKDTGNKEATTPKPLIQPDIHSKEALRRMFGLYQLWGVWHPERYVLFYRLYSIIPFFLLGFWLPFSFAVSFSQLDFSTLEIGNFLTSLQVAINSFMGAVKYFVMVYQLSTLRASEAIMDTLDSRCRDESEIAEIHKVVRQGNGVFTFVISVNCLYATSTFIGAALQGRVPYNLYNPILKWRRSSWEFVAAGFLEYFLMLGLSSTEAISDGYAPLYICIIRAHMKTLLIRIQNLGKSPQHTFVQNYEDLKACIKDHKLLLSFFDAISPIMSITLFMQFMVTAIILGCTLLNILIFAVDISSRIGSCFFVLAVIMEIYPTCYYAQCLLDDSNNLANVIFHSRWPDQSYEFRKLLVVFMQHTQKPMELLAGKLVPVNLATFVSIAKFSFTLYSFINEMGLKERFE
ncbi:odorant receptor 59b-like [Eurosta solidaginis]|uniref:odorant receptor 59b-like n=1 Tax=Eurosta solidaginis TaxID=178769 RepID=UPI0035313B15